MRSALERLLPRRYAVESDKRVDDERVVHRASAINQDLHGFFIGHPRSIRPVRRECVETVDHRENPRSYWNVSSTQTSWIAAAIPVLVVMTNDRHYGIREVNRRQNVRADARVE